MNPLNDVVCNRADAHRECWGCGASVPHSPNTCEPCPFDIYAQCVDIDWITEVGKPDYRIPPAERCSTPHS